jgi:hypothetical protein
MSRYRIATCAALASGLTVAALVVATGGAEARIVCDGNFQVTKSGPVSTLYCQEQNLARVARGYGFHVTEQEIRASESAKAQVCSAIGNDNRVFSICAPYLPNSQRSRR